MVKLSREPTIRLTNHFVSSANFETLLIII